MIEMDTKTVKQQCTSRFVLTNIGICMSIPNNQKSRRSDGVIQMGNGKRNANRCKVIYIRWICYVIT